VGFFARRYAGEAHKVLWMGRIVVQKVRIGNREQGTANREKRRVLSTFGAMKQLVHLLALRTSGLK
jgi:hypothetical protein